MNYKLLKLVIITSWIFSPACFSQDYKSLLKEAYHYYDSKEYKLAIPKFTECINVDSTEYGAFMLRGNCYLELGQNALAIYDYNSALKLKNFSSEILYNLGSAYENSNMVDSAIYFFHKYVNLEPGISEGFVRLSLLFMDYYPEWSDSAIFFASKAVQLEPEKPLNLNYLAMAYYASGKYKSALETAQRGLEIDSGFFLLNQTAGICSFFLKDYASAIDYFNKANRANPKDMNILDYKMQSMILGNTSPEKVNYSSSGKILFRDISSENLKELRNKVLDKGDEYRYSELIKKFRTAPLSMSLDDFFMLYVGFSLQPAYRPYSKPIPAGARETDLAAQAGIMEENLYNNPCDFPLYLELADIYLKMGKSEKYFENRFKYTGFAESVKASGDGISPSTAIIVNDISHEYYILLKLGLSAKASALVKVRRQYYDILSVVNSNRQEVNLYFNIDMPYQTLENSQRKRQKKLQ